MSGNEVKILVTGASGMLGRSVMKRFRAGGIEPVGLAHRRREGFVACDLADLASIAPLLDRFAPDVVVHTAAVRDPDVYASDEKAAYRLNADATAEIARWTGAHGAYLVYISSDYVFDGTAAPYAADAPTKPANAYGASKLSGEESVRRYAAETSCILRVPVLYTDSGDLAESSPGSVLKAVAALRTSPCPAAMARATGGDPLVLDDWAVRYPTHTDDVADIVAQLAARRLAGTYHWTGVDAFTKFDMGVAAADLLGVPVDLLAPSGAPANGSAPRPRDCHLDRSALETLGVETYDTHFRDALPRLLAGVAK